MIYFIVIICLVVALGIHEFGHVLVAQWYGWHWQPIFTKHGPAIKTDASPKTEKQKFLFAAGGPLLSILFGLWILAFPNLTIVHLLLAGWSFDIGLMNLIPYRGKSDGSHMLAALRALNR